MRKSRVLIRSLLAAGLGYWLFTGSVIPVIIMWAIMFINSEMERND
jgi:hypothetical protein